MAGTEGKAMTQGMAGAVIQVKTQGGQLVSGTVQGDGSVEVKLIFFQHSCAVFFAPSFLAER